MQTLLESVSACLGLTTTTNTTITNTSGTEDVRNGMGLTFCKHSRKMGNWSSSDETGRSLPNPQNLRRRIRELGEIYPFSDAELNVLYKCHRGRMLSRGNPHPTSVTGEQHDNAGNAHDRDDGGSQSFLREVAVCSVDLLRPVGDDNDRVGGGGKGNYDTLESVVPRDVELIRTNAAAKVILLEECVLPPGFSGKLERVAFHGASGASHGSSRGGVDVEVGLEDFISGMTRCCGRRGGRSALEIIFDCAAADAAETSPPSSPSQTSKVKAIELVTLAYRLAIASKFLGDLNDEEDEGSGVTSTGLENINFVSLSLDALAESLLKKAESEKNRTLGVSVKTAQGEDENCGVISRNVFIEWAETTVPLMSATIATFMHRLVFRSMPFAPSRQPFLYPDLRGQTSAFFPSMYSPRLFSFAIKSLQLGGAWHRLYTTDSDGLSFNRLQNALLGYAGPTVMIISESGVGNESGAIFGAFTSQTWKESKDFYGNSDCFLYRLEPSVGVFRPRGLNEGKNFMYCNSQARSKGFDGLAHGIGFGGTTAEPRLFIAETFEGCIASSRDMTFEQGALLPHDPGTGAPRKYFEIESLEVWGVGGDDVVADALGARGKQREIAEANVRKAKKVDKAQFMEDFKSGLIESKAFKHRAEMRGRADCNIDDLRNEASGKK